MLSDKCIKIGKYKLYPYKNNSIWIEEKGGEGGEKFEEGPETDIAEEKGVWDDEKVLTGEVVNTNQKALIK